MSASSNRFLLMAVVLLVGAGDLRSQQILQQKAFPAQQGGETILRIPERGYYSLQADSRGRVEMAIIDRMAGRLAARTEAMVRLDLLLDRGEYKVTLHPRETFGGQITLACHPFREALAGTSLTDLPRIGDGQSVYTSLRDLEQRSYWLYVEHSPLRLEVMGRNLVDCKLWRGGEWLDPQRPAKTEYEIEAGNPLNHFEFASDLPRGFYLLTCYGGMALPWTNERDEYPLYIRYGVTHIGESGVREVTISPFGRDAFWVSGQATYFQLIREDRQFAGLTVSEYRAGRSRFAAGESAVVSRDSDDPWCVLRPSPGPDKRWLIIEARPGDELQLRFFAASEGFRFAEKVGEEKRYWISSISSVEANDTIDLTPALVSLGDLTTQRIRPLVVGPSNPLVRRVNVLAPFTAFVQVEESGTYAIVEDETAGAGGTYQFVLLEEALSGTGREPPSYAPMQPIELLAGVYFVICVPERPGILHFALYKSRGDTQEAFLRDANKAVGFLDQSPSQTRHSFAWSNVSIAPDTGPIVLLANPRQEVATSFIIRELPLDLGNPLSIFVDRGGTIEIEIQVTNSSLLRTEGVDHRLTLNGATFYERNTIRPGRHVLRLSNRGAQGAFYTLKTFKTPTTPPPIASGLQEAPPSLTTVKSDFSAYAREQTKPFLLSVAKPALYRIETTGRLATRIDVRTPVLSSLFSATRNGVAQNALIQTYLKAGDYLIEVQTVGRSTGAAGLVAKESEILDAGQLTLNAVDRHRLAADQALRFSLRIDQAGLYEITTHGLRTSFAYRLEDEGGWPIGAAVQRGSFRQVLQPGLYHYYSLPEAFETRRLTVLRRIDQPEAHEGRLFLNNPVRALWRESPSREPDVYRLSLSAPVQGFLTLTKGMEVFAEHTATHSLQHYMGGKQHALELREGVYEFRVRSREENDRVPYTIDLGTPDLVPEVVQRIDTPQARLAVSVGREGIVDIWSSGRSDIEALLWDESGAQLAYSDDMSSDWNFRISRRLAPGRYLLTTKEVGPWGGAFTIQMAIRDEQLIEADEIPFGYSGELGTTVWKIPFTMRSDALVRIAAAASENIVLALYKSGRLVVQTHNELYIPLKAAQQYTLRCWHDGAAAIPVGIQIESRDKASIAHKQIGRQAVSFTLATAALVDAGGSSFRVQAAGNTLLYSAGYERVCAPVQRQPYSTHDDQGWLVQSEMGVAIDVSLSPLVIHAGEQATFMLANDPFTFRIVSETADVVLVEAGSPGLPVGLMAEPTEQSRADFVWDAMVRIDSATLLGMPGPMDKHIRIWNPGRSIQAAKRVDLSVRPFSVQTRLQLEPGQIRTQHVQARGAVVFALEQVNQDLNLLLSPGLVAFAWHDAEPQGAVTATDWHASTNLQVSGGSVLVVNTASAPALLRIASSRRDPKRIVVSREIGYEQLVQRDGSTRLRILSSSEEESLHLAGTYTRAVFRGADGSMSAGAPQAGVDSYRVFPAREGLLEVTHGPGFLSVWIARPEQAEAVLTQFPDEMAASTLDSFVELRDEPQLWTLDLGAAAYVVVDTQAAGMTALLDGERVLELAAGAEPGGRKVARYLEPGAWRVFTRPFVGADQAGVLAVHSVVPEDLEDGAADTLRFMGPHETQVFRFDVKLAGKVGVGVRSDSDAISAKLLDRDSQVLGEGMVVFADLEQGEYLLVIQTSNRAVQYQLALEGLEGSLTTIPPEVIDAFTEVGSQ